MQPARHLFLPLLLSLSLFALGSLGAAELTLEFNSFKEKEAPPGFTSTVMGEGKPGDWQVIAAEVPSLLPPLFPGEERTVKKNVLAQLSQDPTDEHFPILVYDGEEFSDFTIETRFKLVAGKKEQMAGIAFRYKDEDNHYYIRASGLGNSFYFFKVINGNRSAPIGNKMEIKAGVWHTLAIECKASKIRVRLNGKEAIPELDDRSLTSGKIAFWTKSDSVSYFSDTKITYKPRVSLATILVQQAMKRFDRLLDLKIITVTDAKAGPVIIASHEPVDPGTAGWDVEADVIERGKSYQAKEKKKVTVSLPLRDRNGDPIAALRVVMKSFPGQSEKNALARAMAVAKSMQPRVLAKDDLAN